jgi:RNA polymerase sigma factor (sigma-70 family)
MPSHELDAVASDRVAEVFTTHQTYIREVASRHAFNPADVPDIVQNVAISLCRNLNGFRSESHIKTWLFRVTVNKARDFYRGETRRQRHVEAVEADTIVAAQHAVEDPDQSVVTGQRMAALSDALQRLRPNHRQAVLNVWDGAGVQLSEDERRKARADRFHARHALRVHLANDLRWG